jgi:hypothetical protein
MCIHIEEEIYKCIKDKKTECILEGNDRNFLSGGNEYFKTMGYTLDFNEPGKVKISWDTDDYRWCVSY